MCTLGNEEPDTYLPWPAGAHLPVGRGGGGASERHTNTRL